MEFELLKYPHVWGVGFGFGTLDVLKKYGWGTAQTDLAILQGAVIEASFIDGEMPTTPEGEPTCISWTGTSCAKETVVAKAYAIGQKGEKVPAYVGTSDFSFRPIIPGSETSKFSVVGEEKKGLPGVLFVKYGNYPQTIADKRTSDVLEEAFQRETLKKTGKKYTFNGAKRSSSVGWREGSIPMACPEYECDGKKYVRVLGASPANDSGQYRIPLLSNGEKPEEGKPYWVQVEPIEWLVDKSGIWISKKCLFSGFPFNAGGYGADGFEDTSIYYYLNKHFSKEIEEFCEKTHEREKIASSSEYIPDADAFEEKRPVYRTRYPHSDVFEEKNETEENIGDEMPARLEEWDFEHPFSEDKTSHAKVSHKRKRGVEVETEPMSVKDQIDFYIKNGMSFMLHGPSGVGKSARVKEVDPDLTSITLCNGILPEDVIGKTIYPGGADGDKGGRWVPPKWYADLCKKCESSPDKQHVLFIDEVTNARETTQSLIYHVALEKSIAQGVGKLPDNAVVVLAGNSKEESGAAYNMPAPLFRRLSHVYLKPDIPEWLEWASERSKKYPKEEERTNIHPLVSGFVATYGKQVFYSEYDEENPSDFALDPRKWEKVSDKIYANKGVLRRELLAADIGDDLSKTFLEYAKNPPLSLEEVLEGEYTERDIPQKQGARYALVMGLRHASPKQVGKVREFIESHLGAENREIFDSVWVGKDDAKALHMAKLRSDRGR